MAGLPFLVVHGALVWKALDVGFAAGAFAIGRALRERRARRDVRMLVEARLAAVSQVAEGNASLRGHVRGGSLASLVRGEASLDHVSGAWLECNGGTRVELAAAPRVVAGARSQPAMIGTPRGTPAELAEHRRGGRWTLVTAPEGTEVVVTGKLVRAAQADADYRADATTWRLEPDENGAIVVTAVAPRVRAMPPHPVMRAVVLATLLLAGYGILHRVGTRALDRLENPRQERATAYAIAPFGALAIAAAMPGSRDEALEDGASGALATYGRRSSTLALEDALGDLVGGCGTAERQLHEVRLDDALASARACGDRELESVIQLFRGEYVAALALAPARPQVRELAAVGSGAWTIAAQAADDEAATPGDYLDPKFAEREARRAHCRAAFYRARAGASDAFAHVVTTGAQADAECKVLAAFAQPVPARYAALRSLIEAEESAPIDQRDFDVSRWADAMLAMDGQPRPGDHSSDVAFIVSGDDWPVHLAPDTPALTTADRAQRAAVAEQIGDAATARRELAAMPAGMDRDAVADLLALREGTALPAVSYVHPAFTSDLALRQGQLAGHIEGAYPTSCEDDLRAAIEQALAGDGGPLAHVFTTCSVYYIFIPKLLFGILPRVTQHRGELADALRLFRDDITTYSLDHIPFQLISDLSEYRDVARLVGDQAEADRMQAIIARHVHALARDPMAVLMILSR